VRQDAPGRLNDAIKARGISKLALGHHFDDAVETFMMSLMFEGRLSCFRPVTYMDRSGVTQIRPLIYAGEQKIANVAAALELPIVENPCPMDKTSKRYEIKQMLKTMSAEISRHEDQNIRRHAALPLPGWEPDEPHKKGLRDLYYRIADGGTSCPVGYGMFNVGRSRAWA
jgi:tRNA(Ile)-lysidine synthase TilS/MesJ